MNRGPQRYQILTVPPFPSRHKGGPFWDPPWGRGWGEVKYTYKEILNQSEVSCLRVNMNYYDWVQVEYYDNNGILIKTDILDSSSDEEMFNLPSGATNIIVKWCTELNNSYVTSEDEQ